MEPERVEEERPSAPSGEVEEGQVVEKSQQFIANGDTSEANLYIEIVSFHSSFT
jgi:hypothetical protein